MSITPDQLLDEERARAEPAVPTSQEEAGRCDHEERLRIAREVHDIVAHSIATINVQAGTALHVLEKRPDQARAALLAIKQASADAVHELRSTVGTMREADTSKQTSSPRLTRLPDLVSLAQGFGLDADLQVFGDSRDLPSSMDLTAYRIFQESITNVIRHADASRVALSLTYGADHVELSIEDDGRGHDADVTIGEGNGIQGMRERVALIGGSLTVGPRTDGGFRVEARLPYED